MERTSIKYMFAVLAIFIVASSVGMAQENNVDVKYVNFVDNTAHMKVTLQNLNSGNFVYIENYYHVDSNGNQKYYSGKRFEGNMNGKISFDFFRPADRYGQSYTFVESTIIYKNSKIELGTVDLRKYWN